MEVGEGESRTYRPIVAAFPILSKYFNSRPRDCHPEHGVYTLLFVNPDKTRMAPASPDADEEDGAAGRNAERLTGDRHDGGGERLDGSDYFYRYAFDGSGHTQAFLTGASVCYILPSLSAPISFLSFWPRSFLYPLFFFFHLSFVWPFVIPWR